jgi:hypothetical protein
MCICRAHQRPAIDESQGKGGDRKRPLTLSSVRCHSTLVCHLKPEHSLCPEVGPAEEGYSISRSEVRGCRRAFRFWRFHQNRERERLSADRPTVSRLDGVLRGRGAVFDLREKLWKGGGRTRISLFWKDDEQSDGGKRTPSFVGITHLNEQPTPSSPPSHSSPS